MKCRQIFIWTILGSAVIVPLFVFVRNNRIKSQPGNDQKLESKYKSRTKNDQHLDSQYKSYQRNDQQVYSQYKLHPRNYQKVDTQYKSHPRNDQLDSTFTSHSRTDQPVDQKYKSPPGTETRRGNKTLANQHKNGVVTLEPEETIGKIITRDKFGWKILGKEICKIQPDFILSKILPGDVPIFVYPAEKDIHISRMIINSDSWEAPLISKMVSEMKQYPDAVFIDIGANIGIYSLTMAALGYRVIAVDCFIENVKRICASSIYSNNTQKISIIHNGLSNKRVNLKLINSTEPNVGGTEVQQITSQTLTSKDRSSVQAILLDDLLEIFPMKRAVLKMDVEKHEEKVLKGATNFFKNVRVECVLLEFRFHTNKKSGQFIIDFMDKYGLKPILPSGVSKSDYRTWPGDLIWKRTKELSNVTRGLKSQRRH